MTGQRRHGVTLSLVLGWCFMVRSLAGLALRLRHLRRELAGSSAMPTVLARELVRPPVFTVIMGRILCQLLDVAPIGICGVDAFLARCRGRPGDHAEDDLLSVG